MITQNESKNTFCRGLLPLESLQIAIITIRDSAHFNITHAYYKYTSYLSHGCDIYTALCIKCNLIYINLLQIYIKNTEENYFVMCARVRFG